MREINGYRIEPGADLEGANLRWVILRDMCLKGIHLERANLQWATFSDSDLRGACLKQADLRNADLEGAHLEGAHLEGANLEGATLSRALLLGANLEGANLEDTILWETDFTGTNLKGTCLDPSNRPNGRAWRFERDIDPNWVVGYRTVHSPYLGGPTYTRGIYKAPYFSTATTKCHPGLYLYPARIDVKLAYPEAEIIQVLTRPEVIHEAGWKYRCKWFVVL